MSVGATGGNPGGTATYTDNKDLLYPRPPRPHRRRAILFPTPSTVTLTVTFPPPCSPIDLRGRLTPSPVR